VAQEKICSDLAGAVGVAVPAVRLGQLDGHAGVVGVSVAHGAESMDLGLLRTRDPALLASAPVQEGIARASGVLPFHAWVKNADVKDDHLVISETEPGRFTVAAIDFAYTLGATQAFDDQVDPPPIPPALASADKGVIARTVDAIEACSDGQIRDIVSRLPDEVLAPDNRTRLADLLIARRRKVRDAMTRAGLL